MGNPFARTGNIDALAKRGTLYRWAYSSNPVCMPSRASLFTGRHVLAHRVLDNGIWLPESELTMSEVFRRSGYRTAGFGKFHFQTYKPYEGDTSMESMARWETGELDGWYGPYYGFEEVKMTTAHGEGTGGHYGRWRKRAFPDLKLGPENAPGEKFPQFNSWKSNMPLEAYHSTWVADQAIEWLDLADDDKPFFLFVSFPDPHAPFTPPAPYNTMFDEVDFPPPHAAEGENDAKPKPYRISMTEKPFVSDGGLHHYPDLKGAAYNQVVAHTYGMIALIDDCIGRVLAKLAETGRAGETIVVFTCDHGDCLGDHHFLYKAQTPCRSLLHIPLVIADPDGEAGEVEGAVSNVDVMPTLLEKCGIAVPETVQGIPLPEAGGSPQRDWVFEAGFAKYTRDCHHFTLYTDKWRLTVFPYLRDGELYDLENDPHELVNLYNENEYSAVRKDLAERLLAAAGLAETPRPPVLTDW